jgi:hypothetical protein
VLSRSIPAHHPSWQIREGEACTQDALTVEYAIRVVLPSLMYCAHRLLAGFYKYVYMYMCGKRAGVGAGTPANQRTLVLPSSPKRSEQTEQKRDSWRIEQHEACGPM